MTPRSNSLDDRLFHFLQSSRRRLANQLLKALDAKHFFEAVEYLDESIRVENQMVAGREFYFVRRAFSSSRAPHEFCRWRPLLRC